MIEVPSFRCLDCGTELNATGNFFADKKKPTPGDFTVCIDCGHLMVFADDLTLRSPTDPEMVEVAADKRLLLLQEALGYLRKAKD